MPRSAPLPPASLEDLIVLNDEILALTRAGIPLEPALVRLSSELPQGAGELAGEWARRLAQGASLEDLIAAGEGGLPAVYRAVLAAGLRSGKLPAALEGMATAARLVMELRQLVGMSLLYPLFVLILAYLLLGVSLVLVVPWMIQLYHVSNMPPDPWLHTLASIGDVLTRLHIWPVLALVVLAGLWWIFSGRAMAAQPAWADFWLSWLPGMSGLLRATRLATFTEVLALLVEQRVPLADALCLAGDAAGDAALQTATQEAADRIRRGEGPGAAPEGLPPLLGWVLLSGGAGTDLLRSLHYAADIYRGQACDRAQWLRLYLPVILLVAIGGTATVLYALLVLGPWYAMLQRLGK